MDFSFCHLLDFEDFHALAQSMMNQGKLEKENNHNTEPT
jgi:hypothetical protein